MSGRQRVYEGVCGRQRVYEGVCGSRWVYEGVCGRQRVYEGVCGSRWVSAGCGGDNSRHAHMGSINEPRDSPNERHSKPSSRRSISALFIELLSRLHRRGPSVSHSGVERGDHAAITAMGWVGS